MKNEVDSILGRMTVTETEHRAGTRTVICPTCNGYGFVIHDHKIGHPDFGKAKPCPTCSAERQMDTLRRLSGLRYNEYDLSIGNISPFSALFDIKKHLKQMCERPSHFLTLWGGFGVGKTHALKTIVAEGIRNGFRAHYTTLSSLMDYLRAAYSPDADVKYDQRWDFLVNVDILAIDEYGIMNPTPWAMEKWHTLIILRHERRFMKGTILSGNAPPSSLDDLIYSRISETDSKTFHLKGRDMRPYEQKSELIV